MSHSILVVEDDRPLREVLQLALLDDDYVVHGAADGIAALSLLDETAVDLIITDIHMPRLDGRGFIVELANRQNRTPVIVMSAFRLTGLDDRAAAILLKPFDLDTLLETVERVLANTSPS